MSLLEQDSIKKKQVKKVSELDTDNNGKEYEVEAIGNSAVYTIELESSHLPGFYYLVA